MLQKHLKIAVLLLILLVPLTISGILRNGKQFHMLSKGNYFFEQTRRRADIASISISFPDGHTVTIEKKDDFWRIAEADDYFASFAKINALTSLIRNTVIYRADPIRKNDAVFSDRTKHIVITSKDTLGGIVDKATIAIQSNTDEKQPLRQKAI